MQIEISEATNEELQRRAAAVGLGVSEYLDVLVLAFTEPAEPGARTKPYTVEEWRANLEKSNARLGRNGRPWREFIHEGHKY